MKRTKIVCTLGPSTDSPEVLGQLIDAGMNVARFNFSHGNHADHLRRLTMLREAEAQKGIHIAALCDLQGPKIRVGRFKQGPVQLIAGKTFTITNRAVEGDETLVSTTHSLLPQDVKAGDTILLADGLLELSVTAVSGTDVTCKVVVGGPLSNNKGINLPHSHVSAPCVTEKDLIDLDFALDNDFDFVALSFVRKADDLEQVRQAMRKKGKSAPLVAKIEKPQAVLHFEEILAATDAIMIARGDLGVEMPPESVPAHQKEIIRQCRQVGVPVITATQMLESMIENPRPTRAEASDVANAIFDGTDAVMLSAESANGKYPTQACGMMSKIAKVAEVQEFPDRRHVVPPHLRKDEAVSAATCAAANSLGAECIVLYATDWQAVRLVAKQRPRAPILALTPDVRCARQLALVCGVTPVVVEPITTAEGLLQRSKRALLENRLARSGDTIVLAAGVPLTQSGSNNMMMVTEV